ncbi:MAG TPA: copper resistance CopC family protein [Acetobacteraceae bacterium]|jgi:methionine-rich copper-binding protein CopC|nr:copper resistance CopC family protein [Acetobacteraceae bacterium]
MTHRNQRLFAARPEHGQGRRRVLSLLPALALLLVPWPARAHAVLEQSTPAAGGRVPAGAVAFRLQYNSRVDAGRSRLTLVKPDKTGTVLPIGKDSTANVLTAAATLPPGSYVLRWQALAVDGHITHGEVPFTVQAD